MEIAAYKHIFYFFFEYQFHRNKDLPNILQNKLDYNHNYMH